MDSRIGLDPRLASDVIVQLADRVIWARKRGRIGVPCRWGRHLWELGLTRQTVDGWTLTELGWRWVRKLTGG